MCRSKQALFALASITTIVSTSSFTPVSGLNYIGLNVNSLEQEENQPYHNQQQQQSGIGATCSSSSRTPTVLPWGVANTNNNRKHLSSLFISSSIVDSSATSTESDSDNGQTSLTTSSSTKSSSKGPTSQSTDGRVNKFQNGVYDKPIVLIGCRGAGDELNRLASSFISTSSPNSAAQTILDNSNPDSSSSSSTSSNKKNSIIPAVGTDSRGTWVLSPSDLQEFIDTQTIDNSNVIVLDFDHSVFHVDEGKNAKKLTQHLSALAQALYENDLLVMYVNVGAESSGMSLQGKERKEQLENDVFIAYSDYEICIKKEGLGAMTIMAQQLLLNDGDSTKSSDDSTALKDEDIMIPTDPFTNMLTIDTPEKEAQLRSIEEGQLSAWDYIEWNFQRLLARAFLPLATPGSTEPSINSAHYTMGQNAFFLSLSFPDINDAQPYIEEMCQDVDAMEFRADLLSCRDDRFDVLYSMQQIRNMCRPHASRAPMLPLRGEVIDDVLPIVYTVRTAHQAGTYPDDPEGISQMFELLELGLRNGVEVLDMESAWDKVKQDALLKKVEDRYASQVLGSHHMVGDVVTPEEAVSLYQQCSLEGRAHGAKVVLSIDDKADDKMAYEASEVSHNLSVQKGKPIIPHVGLILGDIGKYSRVLNIAFTPVTHESLPFVAAPGQMTASELMATRVIMGLVPSLKYGILGHNIAYSVSPAMQGAAFAATKLPHSYSLIDMESVDEFVNSDFWNDELFGGCSVTIPHKQAIIPHLDELTEAAEAIGAVNTVIVEKEDNSSQRKLIGDNTDWKGIFNPLSRKLGISSANEDAQQNPDEKKGVALILGGGGTARAAAYAASKLGLERVYYNRTPSKAQELAESFGGTAITSLEQSSYDPVVEKFNLKDATDGENNSDDMSLGNLLQSMNGEVRVVISTLPAAVGFELPKWFINGCKEDSTDSNKPIIFDVNYKPYWTNLLYQADKSGFPIVRGSEMLWEQGVGQFELWTGRTAPYKVMKQVVLSNCLPIEDEE